MKMRINVITKGAGLILLQFVFASSSSFIL